ncbi:MAG TPA: CocE/NonD family hydrolase, partial [Candidatus Thermoplasmatota archaeon]|nr:CocE/NonD family hydrolase [Candidatus Thermoplasmatota archaeon]
PAGQAASAPIDIAPYLGYKPPAPDLGLEILEEEALIDAGDVDIHVRIKRPETGGKVPVVVQFTPYTAGAGSVGQNPALNAAAEPAGCAVVAGDCESNFDVQFVRRGYAFAYGDVRGTGDSSGCLSLRGPDDIADAGKVIEWLGTQDWSNGKVGFIGASYPGSEAHIAAIAEAGAKTGHLGAVIPVVASTSFYHYHHNDGVPYNGNHALGGTNTGYTSNAVAPTINPQNPNFVPKYLEELTCPTKENVVDHGGMDQSGAYYEWWQERNLRAYGKTVTVPVLMAQGLADWNVKPDHIATYFNDVPAQKTLIAGQWPHQYPRSDGADCKAYDAATACDPDIPWGDWWEYATAFFDTHLKGVATGMFSGDVAWVQDNQGAWHRSAQWPLQEGREEMAWHLQPGGSLTGVQYSGEATDEPWLACPHDQTNRGTPLGAVEPAIAQCDNEAPVEELVFESPPFAEDTILSGVGLVNLTLKSTASTTHLVVVLEVGGERENYGYLNPVYRNGLMDPQPLPSGEYTVSIDLYPQEDVVKAGQSIRLIVRSNDRGPAGPAGEANGRTIESYEPGTNSIAFAPDSANFLWLPVRPADLQGVRLA